MLLKIFTAALQHQMDGDARGIGSDVRACLAVLIYFVKNLLFDVQIFDNHLDDPITIHNFGHVIIKVAGFDPTGKAFVKQSCRLGFEGVIQGLIDDAIAGGRVVFVLILEVKRDNVEHEYFQTNVGQMAGNTSTHYSRTQYRSFSDSFHVKSGVLIG